MYKMAFTITLIVLFTCLSGMAGTIDVQSGQDTTLTGVDTKVGADTGFTASETCAVTYIANEGFLIETGNHKILIDALFGHIEGDWCDQPGDSVLNKMIKGVTPFDNVDLALITHKHVDHFSEPIVLSFMKNNRKAVLICPNQVNEMLKRNPDYSMVADRISTPMPQELLDSCFTINGVNIRALKFDHGKYFVTDSVSGKTYNLHEAIENLGYLISANGFLIFHSGDDSPLNETPYKDYDFANNEVDLAFLNRSFLGAGGMDMINKYIHAKNIVFMHVEPQKFEYYRSAIKDFPKFIIFSKQMDKMEFSKNK